MLKMRKVAVIMGSESDLPVVKNCIIILKSLEIPVDVHVISAHRTPNAATQFAVSAIDNGYGIIIAAAGKAAHLAGTIAAHTTLPVIGIPIKSSTLDGLDSLLSTVQMPKGVPVATVAIDGAYNAGILAAQILALSEPQLSRKLIEMKQKMAEEVIDKDLQIQAEVNKL
jgi:5-(carboxyamino)imidazole ribonucleotide mutase